MEIRRGGRRWGEVVEPAGRGGGEKRMAC
ncbi:hypothetical protein CCACVL1_16996 [Corchorus capsularis]|uniref:Uncharacterized protein n=1 Tax=Corchorus capsularis TaxID=210143 RepID=A0A1R3HV29_COCAP|nr:hypothetical protein CCACVL1_16996 [Corchorus capsularis]